MGKVSLEDPPLVQYGFQYGGRTHRAAVLGFRRRTDVRRAVITAVR